MRNTLKKGQGYNEEFKQSIVNLYRNGKTSGEIMSEYGISSSSFYKWLKKYSVVQLSETESMTMLEIKAMQKRSRQFNCRDFAQIL